MIGKKMYFVFWFVIGFVTAVLSSSCFKGSRKCGKAVYTGLSFKPCVRFRDHESGCCWW